LTPRASLRRSDDAGSPVSPPIRVARASLALSVAPLARDL
jgi:hypothetical protein